MKTEELIKALTADNATLAPPISRTVLLSLLVGAAIAVVHFFNLFAMRSDFAHAITHDPRFMLKFVFALGLAVPALLIVLALSRPNGTIGGLKWLLVAPVALLAFAVAYEMLTVPRELWQTHAMGTMPAACLKSIPILSVAPFVAMFYALRNGATTHPASAGAAAGLLSGTLGAVLYATFCVDDSPMFLAIWYVMAIAIVTALGAIIGNRLLRW